MKVKDMCFYALLAVLIAVGAFIKLPISIVPITLQTLFIGLAAFVLKEKAVYSVLLYVGMGLLGLPVFTSGGGLSYIFVPSFGYLIGFIFGSYFVGRYKNDIFQSLFIRGCLGMLIIYVIGIAYFVCIEYFYYGQVFAIEWIMTSLFLIYIPGDLISIIVAIIVYKRFAHRFLLK